MSIYESLAAVMADCDHVAKRDRNTQQNFAFRGIDAVVNAVGPILRKHQVIVAPLLVSADYAPVTLSGGKVATSCRLIVEYTFYAVDGSSVAARVAAEAFDLGDKATPKAMSVAFRTALLQALALPTDEPDPDSQSYEQAERQPDPMTAAKAAVRAAWEALQPWDPAAMREHYEMWCAQPIGDATPEDLTKYAERLRSTS
jgi:hypothetical protein